MVKSAEETSQTFDYIVCCHKAVTQGAIPEQIAAGVDKEKTTIVVIQNSVRNEEPFRNRFPSATIFSCVVRVNKRTFPTSHTILIADPRMKTWCGVRQPEPGVITHTKSEDMQTGLFPNSGRNPAVEAERLHRFVSLLTGGKTKFQVVPNIQVQRWQKVVWNAAWEPLTVLTLMGALSWLSLSKEAMPMTRRLMKEVIDVARAFDMSIEYSLVDRLIVRIKGVPPIGSSMCTDFENGKPLEVDVILGYHVRKGRERNWALT